MLLSIIAESEPQSAYSAFVGGFKGKRYLFYAHNTIVSTLIKTIRGCYLFQFIPAITGRHLCSDNDPIRLSLPVRFGGLAIPLFHNDAKYEYEKSRKLRSSLTQLIRDQYQIYSVYETEENSIKSNIKINKERYEATLTEVRTQT